MNRVPGVRAHRWHAITVDFEPVAKHPDVRTYRADIALLKLDPASVDVIFMNAMYGNIADKPRACRNAARMLRPGGRLVVSHPEGRAFVDQLRMTSDLFIESLPSREEFQALLQPLGLEVLTYRDESKLYLMVAQERKNQGNSRVRRGKS